MKCSKILPAIFIAVLAVPAIAHACFQLVGNQVNCDDCGNMVGSLKCSSGASYGFSTCDDLGEFVPCQGNGGGCYGTIAVAVGHGTCHSNSVNSDNGKAIVVSVFVPTSHEGYRQAEAALFPSCDRPN